MAQTFVGLPVSVQHAKLDARYTHYEVYRLDAAAINNFVATEHHESNPLSLYLGDHHFDVVLHYNDMFDEGFRSIFQSEQGETAIPLSVSPYQGYSLNGVGDVRLTLANDFIYGSLKQDKTVTYIQPLWYVDPAFEKDLFLVYHPKDVLTDGLPMGCGAEHNHEHDALHEDIDQKLEEKMQMDNSLACYQVDLAIASDASMLSKYGSAAAVQAHNVAVLNDVEGDYTGNFNHDIKFNIVIQVVSASNPWGANAEAGTYLDNFRTWGNGGGFGVAYDLAELWTNIDLNGPTIGIAYLTAVCTTNKYHVLQDFSGNADLLRVLTSHEIGHNFSASHDNCPTGGTVYIMCPFVSTSTEWSSNSISSISNHITSRINNGCLQPCATGPAPTPNFSWNPNPGCTNQPITFTDESTGNITTYNWTFPGGVPATSTQPTPSVTWATPGVKNVTLVLNTGTAQQANISKQVTVQGGPTANFTSTTSGLTVSFDATATNATSYEWDFGDGGFSNEEDPVYTYTEGNYYTVILTVTGPCGTATKTVTLNTAPTTDFEPSVTSGCAPLAVSFTNLSSPNATSYVWQFPGGAPSSSNQANPVVLYQISGVYSVTLTAYNSIGSAVASYTNLITVQNIPSASIAYAATGNTVNFTGSSNTGTSFLWNFGNGATSTQQNPTYTYPAGGTYTVTFTAINPCGSSTATQTIVLEQPPTAAFTASPSSGCGPLTVTFTNTSSNANSYQWSFPGGNPSTSTAANVTVTYINPGTYTATLTAVNAAGPNTATQSINVQTTPSTAFSAAVTGASAAFTNTTTNATSYFWNFGDGNNSTAANPTHTYTADGTYQVVLSALNGCGTSTFVQTVTIVTPPTANFSANATSGCGPLTVQFSNASSSNAATFAWQFPGGTPATSNLANPTVVYATPGQYNVVLTVSNAAGSNTATQSNYVTVLSTPTASFTAATNGYQATFTSTAQSATAYAWAISNGTTSNQQNFSTTFATAGTYTVTLTASNDCGSSTAVQTVTIVESPTASFSATPTTGCNTLTVQFTNTSAGNPTSFEWQFPGGNPATSTVANPSVTYNMPGTYTVVFTASNSAGSGSVTQTNYITVGTGPTAGFTAATSTNTVTFTNGSTGATSYSWNFGDGNSSTAANPVHSYANDGTYTVVLTAINACGTQTSTQTVTIVTLPTAAFTVNGGTGCAPLTVTFSNTSSANATSFNWQFPGGNPASSTAANPTVTYASAGTYAVALTVSNSAGTATASQANAVVVGANPSPSFLVNMNGASVSFTNTSTNSTAYSWDFGDGGTSASANPSHMYLNDGIYTVVLTATNACGTATSTQTITVVTPPTANFTATGNIGCAPLTVTFNNASSSNATSFSWLFPGGNPASSTAANPTVTYAAPGQYSVVLTASNTQGNATVTQTNFVLVGSAPSAGFQVNMTGAAAAFTSTSVGATAYNWNFGDGNTSTEQDPNHTYATDGVYTVVLTASNTCGTATFTQTVTVVTPPTAAFIANNTQGCAPLTVSYQSLSSSNATDFIWLFPGGTPATSTEANPTVTYDQAGTFSVTLTASNAAGTATAFQENIIVVNAAPTPLFTYQIGGVSVQFTNASFNATSYLWNFGDGNTSTEVNPVHDYAVLGTYTVTLRATNNCGTTEFEQQVTIKAGNGPIASFTAGNQTVGCVPFEVQFNDLSIGQPTAWEWSFILNGDVEQSANVQNPLVTFTTPGIYDVQLKVTNQFGVDSSTITQYITVNNTPTANFEVQVGTGGTVTLQNTTQGALSYIWDFGDGSPTSTEANPTHVYSASGTYTVSLSAINECGVSVYQVPVNVVIVGVNNIEWVREFELFPNPNKGTFAVNMKGDPSDMLRFNLYNVLGQLLKTDEEPFGTGQMSRQFQYQMLPSGTYWLQVSNGATTFVVPFVVE